MAIINERKKVNDFQFNNDASCFAVATNSGFKIFSTNPLKELVSRDNIGELSKVEILEKTNIIAYVGTQNNSKFSNNKLVLWDDDLQHPVGDIQFPSEILGFKIYRDRIVVALLTTTYLYDLQNLQLLQSIETHANPHGVCEFNRNGTKALVTLGARQGSLRISYPDLKNSPIKEIFAHNGPIRCVSLDKTGKYLASASEKGTIIRVFDLTRNELSAVRIFRRGSESAIISSIIFDPTSKFLCVSSSTETIHIFSMENTSFYSYLKSYYTSEIRSSIKLKLPLESEGLKSICCFNSQLNTVHVVNQDGRFFKYAIDLQVESEKNFESYLHFI